MASGKADGGTETDEGRADLCKMNQQMHIKDRRHCECHDRNAALESFETQR